MRSLWSGVSGLRVHQVGMDVEGNNIANVNTYGFKYSRVNYSTMFAQTMAIATQPTDTTGGKNAKQVGLGVMAAATQRIHSQGSISGTDSNYDVAIEGNGFFLVSNDGGKTRYLTRDGAFNQDAAGNFVNSNGYVVQGWVRDPVTGRIDTALSPGNLSWDPAMNLPANPSSSIFLNAQLNSGRKITQETSRYIYSLDSAHGRRTVTGADNDENGTKANQFYTKSNNSVDVTEKAVDFASVFNGSTYEGLNLRNGQSFWFSYADAKFTTAHTGLNNALFDPNNNNNQQDVIFWGSENHNIHLDITLNGVNITSDAITSIDTAAQLIQGYSSQTGVEVSVSTDKKSLIFTNRNANGTEDNMKNISLTVNQGNEAGELATINLGAAGGATYNITAATNNNSTWFTAANQNSESVITAHRYEYSHSAVDIPAMHDPVSGNPPFNAADLQGADQTTANAASRRYAAALIGDLNNRNARIFHSTEDLRELMQRDARYGVDYNSLGHSAAGTVQWAQGGANANAANSNINLNVKLEVNSTGRYVFSNPAGTATLNNVQFDLVAGGTYGSTTLAAGQGVTIAPNTTSSAENMTFQATAYKNEQRQISTNDALANLFKSMQGVLDVGNETKQSVSMVLSSFSTSLEMYDSLGTLHLLNVEWTKHETTVDGGNLWQMILRLDEPATFNAVGLARNNIIVGSVRFGNDGSLTSFEPTEFTFSGNNGSAPNQRVELNLGASAGFNGLVSNEQTSALSQQQTDGYAPGVLKQGMQNMSIDQNGVIMGSFTNGITMPMGKIAMGNVVNEAGLQDMGNNLWAVSNNSGTLTIGAPNVGGRGAFKSGALELSNADLSLSLTNLIVIQRGYQANSKTITTSDTMLNTLLQLKQ